jgi:hypothetical protein
MDGLAQPGNHALTSEPPELAPKCPKRRKRPIRCKKRTSPVITRAIEQKQVRERVAIGML